MCKKGLFIRLLGIIAIVGVVFGAMLLITFPTTTPAQTLDNHPYLNNIEGFSGTETHPDGYRFGWAGAKASLLYSQIPRYAPLNLRLKLNLNRPAGRSPARVEIYESTFSPATEPRLVGVLTKTADNAGPLDYYLTIPRRESGKGLLLELKSDTFQPPNDRRELSYIFVEAEVNLPRTHILSLFWPQPYWVAGLLLLLGLATWSRQTGLGWLESLALTAMTGFVVATSAAANYQQGWWLLLTAVGFGAAFFWFWGWDKPGRKLFGPLIVGSGLLILFFLIIADGSFSDAQDYLKWSATLQREGLWKIYQNESSLNYLPLIPTFLWVRNWLVFPLGLGDSILAWRVTAALIFLACVALLYRFMPARLPTDPAQPCPTPPGLLIIIGFNAALFYNPVIIGQSDILVIFLLLACFFAAVRSQKMQGARRKTEDGRNFRFSIKNLSPQSSVLSLISPLTPGLIYGLVLISKPQAWFIAPFLGWIIWRKAGWRKALSAIAIGGSCALLIAAITFGLDWGEVLQYFQQPEFIGTYQNDFPVAFNFSYLVMGVERIIPPTWMNLLGLAVIACTFGLVIWTTRRRDYPHAIERYAFGAGLIALAFFCWAIKMKERYLLYSLFFLAIAVLQNRRLLKPFITLCWVQLIQTVIVNYGHVRYRTAFDFYWWNSLFIQDATRRALSVITLLMFFYFVAVYVASYIKPTRPVL